MFTWVSGKGLDGDEGGEEPISLTLVLLLNIRVKTVGKIPRHYYFLLIVSEGTVTDW